MKVYSLEFKQEIQTGIQEAWDFFSSPANLARITPPQMEFIITSNYSPNKKMYPGMIITYKIGLMPGVRINWVTEITQVKEHAYFIDEQRFGPYKFWHHQHHFNEIPGGVLMTDILNYAIPFGIFGKIAADLYVKNEIDRIFRYRREKIEEIFAKR